MCSECVKVDIKRLGLIIDDAHNRDMWRSLTTGTRPALSQCGDNFRSTLLFICRPDNLEWPYAWSETVYPLGAKQPLKPHTIPMRVVTCNMNKSQPLVI